MFRGNQQETLYDGFVRVDNYNQGITTVLTELMSLVDSNPYHPVPQSEMSALGY